MTNILTESINTIIDQASRLPDPQNYYSGLLTKQRGNLPDSILIFHRQGICSFPREGSIHSRYLLNINIGAECTMFLDGKKVILEPGNAILVYPFQSHLFIHDTPEIFRLMIGFEISAAEFLPARHHVTPLSSNTATYLHQMMAEYLSRANATACSHLLCLILNELTLQAIPAVPVAHSPRLKWLEDLCHYIHQHIQQPLAIEDLAHQFHVSASHLRLKFRRQTGMSLGTYITKAKMSKATQLLDTSTLTITQLSEQCGYESVQAFSRAFSREIGMSPLTYRQHSRSKNSLPGQ